MVLPVNFFLGQLELHKQGGPADVSRFTCHLGLITVALFSIGVPGLLSLLGFWPLL
jgi:hypothetical protein